MDEQDLSSQEERLRYVFSEVLSRIFDDGESVRRLEFTFPSAVEATYRIHYRGIEDFEGGVVSSLD